MVAANAPASGSPSSSGATAAAAAGAAAPAQATGRTPVSPAKLAANRGNAQKSTGPRTEAGKAASRMNAIKHGLRAEMCVLPGEDAAEFAEFVDAAVRELRPAGALQASYAREVAVQTWRLRRVPAAEALLFARHDPMPEDYDAEVIRNSEDFRRLFAADPAELSLDDAERLEEITKDLVEAERRAAVRATNADGAGYPDDDPAYTADVLAAMLRSRRTMDHSPDSVLWTCQRYEAQILRARSTALRELLKLQKAYGAAPEDEDVWPGEQVRVGYPDLPEDDEEEEDGDEEAEGGDEEDEGPDGEQEEEEPPEVGGEGADEAGASPNEATVTASAAPRTEGNAPAGAERTQTAPAPAPQHGPESDGRPRAAR